MLSRYLNCKPILLLYQSPNILYSFEFDTFWLLISGLRISEMELDEILDNLDRNKDGLISKKEFLKIFLARPEQNNNTASAHSVSHTSANSNN